MSAPHCAHVKTNGEPCRGYAVAGSRYCFAHDPAQADKRDDARRRGGTAGTIPPLEASDIRVSPLGDVLALVELTINDVRAGRVDVKIANSVGYLANIAMKAIEQSDLEARLDALEAVLEPERARALPSRRRAA